MRNLTQYEYENKVKKYNQNIIVLGEYKNNRSRIHVKCTKCDYEWQPKAQSLIDGVNKNMCPNCHNNKALHGIDLYNLLDRDSTEIVPLYYKEYDNEVIHSKDNILLYDGRCKHTYVKTYNQILTNGCNCPYCGGHKVSIGFNDLATTHSWMKELLNDENDAYKYTANSNKATYFKCPICKELYYKIFNDVCKHGLSCKNCSDGISYPEKFMMNLLNQCNISYIYQYAVGDYMYDFYLPDYNYIIELHGQQHYDNSFQRIRSQKRNVRDEIQNDIDKKEYIYRTDFNGEYIVIDCRQSQPLFIKDSIMANKKLASIINFDNIDVYYIHQLSLKSNVLVACGLYNNKHTINDIMSIMHLSRSTIIRYLKYGKLCGLCNYDTEKQKILQLEALRKSHENHKKSVRCITTNKTFDSLKEASEFYQISVSLLSGHLAGRRRRAGVDKDTQQDMIWEFI